MIALLALRPSPRLAAVLAVAHLAAAAAVCATSAGPLIAAGLWLAIAGSWRRAHRHVASRSSAGAVVALAVDRELRVAVRERGGRVRRGRVVPGTRVTPTLVVLRFRADGARFARAVVLPSDGADAEPLRQLRVILRWSTI